MKKIDVLPNDLLWLAGLLEGDGHFSLSKKSKSKPNRCGIKIQMIDADTVEKVASIFKVDMRSENRKKINKNHNKTYTAEIHCNKSLSLMKLLSPYMGVRRQQKIHEIIDIYNNKLPRKTIDDRLSTEKLKELLKAHSCAQIALLYGVSRETVRVRSRQEYKSRLGLGEYFDCHSRPLGHKDTIFWLAGLLEAEGSFMKGPPSSPNLPVISIQMTDKDIMETVSEMFGTSLSSFQPKGQTKDGLRPYKKVYICQVRGSFAINLMKEIKPLMSVRRQKQIQVALESNNSNAREEYYERQRSIPFEKLEEIFLKRKDGQTLSHIAKQYSVTRNVIRRALARYDKQKN